MTTPLYDAHCHWQDARLLPHRERIAADMAALPLRRAVVNGTGPHDWELVAALATAQPQLVQPAFGLHPWRVNACPDPQQWLPALRAQLEKFPNAVIGETGLDNWLPDADKALQREAFLLHLQLAVALDRPITIHCLRAEADLLSALKAAPALPARGIHLHGFAGSLQSARELLKLGAYFSFSEYIAEPRRAKARAIAAEIPPERLLAETDAPDMRGPDAWQHYRLEGNAAFAHAPEGLPPKHPANIVAAYACLAKLRHTAPDALAAQIEANFLHYFGSV